MSTQSLPDDPLGSLKSGDGSPSGGISSLWLVLLGAALALGVLALVLNVSSYASTRHGGTGSYSVWVPGPTPDPPSNQATACNGTQAELADEVLIDARIPAFSAAEAAQNPATMDRLRNEIVTATLPPCAHRAERFVLEWMRAGLVQVQAELGNADAAYVDTSRQNTDAWYRVMAQEMAALVQRDFRNSGKE